MCLSVPDRYTCKEALKHPWYYFLAPILKIMTLFYNFFFIKRIAGNTALDKDLITTQMNLRSKWKVWL
jgi:hypothetical protein